MESNHLKEAGLKITVPRLKILHILEEAKNPHMSAEDVYNTLQAANEDVALATVYRVLTQFEAAGIVKRHNFADDYAVFELNQKEHHDHLVCVKCGRVQEFADAIIEQRQQLIAEQANFEMTDHSLNIYGICSECR